MVINDFYNATKFSSIKQFADDTKLLCDSSLKQLNKDINKDLKLEITWTKQEKRKANFF